MTTGPGNFTKGLIWAGPYSKVTIFIARGDLPSFKEYHWRGLQNLAGNAYILTGIAMLVILAVAARRMTPGRPRTLRLTAGRPRTGPRPGQAEP